MNISNIFISLNIHSIAEIDHHFNLTEPTTVRAARFALNLRNRLQSFRNKFCHWHVGLVTATSALEV